MGMYGDRRDEPPTELELEQQRAGVDAGPDPVSEEIASPLWVAGLGPTSGSYGPSAAAEPGGKARRGIGSRIRSMFGRAKG
jgi:hypothetical protein